ncbi:MAG: hypothetical protein WBH66_09575 [Rectinemataceae bacterium]
MQRPMSMPAGFDAGAKPLLVLCVLTNYPGTISPSISGALCLRRNAEPLAAAHGASGGTTAPGRRGHFSAQSVPWLPRVCGENSTWNAMRQKWKLYILKG